MKIFLLSLPVLYTVQIASNLLLILPVALPETIRVDQYVHNAGKEEFIRAFCYLHMGQFFYGPKLFIFV